MHFINVGSGSKGNSSLLIDEDYIILIDAGISKRRVNAALKKFNKNIDDISVLLITHDHIDHISQIKNYKKEIIYSTPESYKCLKKNYLKYFKEKRFNNFLITPFPLSHDSTCTGYLIKFNDLSLGYVTDTGYIPLQTLNLLKNLSYYYFESNYDIDLLVSSRRSDELKSRILSHKGHLGNEESAAYLSFLIGENTKKVMLAHLSEECNTSLIALTTHYNVYRENDCKIEMKNVITAKQKEETELC